MEIFKMAEKVKSKYRPVATISQIEIAPHAPAVLVGECLPQTLLLCRALHTGTSSVCVRPDCARS